MIECPGSDALVTITDALDWNAQEVLAHMHTCADCRARLATIAQTHEAFAPEPVPDYLVARIDETIAKEARKDAVAERKRAGAARGVEMVLAGATGAMIALTAGTSPANVAALAGTFVLFAMVPVVTRTS